MNRRSAGPHWSSVKDAVDGVRYRPGRHIHEQKVRTVTHPLESRRRRIEAERSPIGVVIGWREEQWWQDRTHGPAAVCPAIGIDKWCDVNPVDRASAKSNRSWPDWRPAKARADWTANARRPVGNSAPGRRYCNRVRGGDLCGGPGGAGACAAARVGMAIAISNAVARVRIIKIPPRCSNAARSTCRPTT